MDFGSLFLFATMIAILPLLLGFYLVYLLKQSKKTKSIGLNVALALVIASFAATIAYHVFTGFSAYKFLLIALS